MRWPHGGCPARDDPHEEEGLQEDWRSNLPLQELCWGLLEGGFLLLLVCFILIPLLFRIFSDYGLELPSMTELQTSAELPLDPLCC